eukprot:comp6991_c0_seq2/m.2726 comp6991_c0_seq2/g.2726  ORF comp6991_c0_seq2/g.2726 comp6991_c0_seq2/m.2726 type:complete len:102 (-) comp6991_c0_seq2:545-850(-)
MQLDNSAVTYKTSDKVMNRQAEGMQQSIVPRTWEPPPLPAGVPVGFCLASQVLPTQQPQPREKEQAAQNAPQKTSKARQQCNPPAAKRQKTADIRSFYTKR